MLPWHFSEIGLFVVMLLITLVQGVLSYTVMRIWEKAWPILAAVLAVPSVGLYIFLFARASSQSPRHVLWIALTTLPALLGGYFHRRAGGASRNWATAWVVMLAASWLCTVSGAFFRAAIEMGKKGDVLPFEGYRIGLMTFPILVPLALWLWQRGRSHRDADGLLENPA